MYENNLYVYFYSSYQNFIKILKNRIFKQFNQLFAADIVIKCKTQKIILTS